VLITQGSVVRIHAGPLRKAEEGIDDLRLTIDDCLVERVGKTTWLRVGKASPDGEVDRDAKLIHGKASIQRRKSAGVKA
jgi:hypothetical protein